MNRSDREKQLDGALVDLVGKSSDIEFCIVITYWKDGKISFSNAARTQTMLFASKRVLDAFRKFLKKKDREVL